MFDVRMMTARRPGGVEYFSKTLASLYKENRRAAPEYPVTVLVGQVDHDPVGFADRETFPGLCVLHIATSLSEKCKDYPPWYRLICNFYDAFSLKLSEESLGCLVLEDDLIFAPAAFELLEESILEAMSNGLDKFFISAYCPYDYSSCADMQFGKCSTYYRPNEYYGNQAIFCSRALLPEWREWLRVHGVERKECAADLLLGKFCQATGAPILMTKSSLVQHVGVVSTGVGHCHQSALWGRPWPVYEHEWIQGWFDFPDVYDGAVRAARDGDVFVEIGSWLGKSAVYMAKAIKASGKKIHFYCVDTWEGAPDVDVCQEIIRKKGGARNLFREFIWNSNMVGKHCAPMPIMSDSADAASLFKNGEVSFAFIDANHSYDHVRRDIAAWLPKIRSGGVIAGHDYTVYKEVRTAVDESLRKPRYNVNVLGASWWTYV